MDEKDLGGDSKCIFYLLTPLLTVTNTAWYCYMVRTGSDDVMAMDYRSMHPCHGAKCLVRNKPHEPNNLHEEGI